MFLEHTECFPNTIRSLPEHPNSYSENKRNGIRASVIGPLVAVYLFRFLVPAICIRVWLLFVFFWVFFVFVCLFVVFVCCCCCCCVCFLCVFIFYLFFFFFWGGGVCFLLLVCFPVYIRLEFWHLFVSLCFSAHQFTVISLLCGSSRYS